MAKSPSRTPLIAAAILVLACLAGFNALNEKYRPKSEKEMEAEQRQAQEDAAKKAPKTGAAATPPPTPGQTGSGDPSASASLMQLGPDKVLGAKTAKTTITVGWSWTPDVQGDPNKVWGAVKALQQAVPNAQIRVVNTDEVSGVPDGVSIGGSVVVPPAPDGGLPSDQATYKPLATGVPVPPGPPAK